MFSGNIKLVEAFKGLSGDQKFGIYPFGLTLVFDYLTPQFETQCAAATSIINFSDLGDVFSFTKRFYKDGSQQELYASSEPARKSLIGKGRVNEVSGEESFKVGNISVFRSWRYSASLPEEIKKRLEKMRTTDQQEVNRINREYEALTQLNGKSGAESGEEGSCEIHVDSYQYGKYINVTHSLNCYVQDRFSLKMDTSCYDADTFDMLELKDLFWDGYDYKPLVLRAIKEAYSGDANEQTVEKIYDEIAGFNLSSNEIYIPIRQQNEDGSSYDMHLYLPFSEIGCDNLMIFH